MIKLAGRWRVELLAMVAGILSALAFPPFNLYPLVLVGICILYGLLRRGADFATGFLYGVGLLAPMLSWLIEFHVLGPHAVIILSAIPYGVAACAAGERKPIRFAAAFTAAEFFRSIGMLGLPWGVVGSLAAAFPFRSVAAVAGLFGLSFGLYLACAGLVEKWKVALPLILAVVVVIVAGSCPLLANLSLDRLGMSGTRSPACDAAASTLRIGLIQGNFSQERDYEFEPDFVFAYLLSETKRLAADGARVVVWTETVVLEYLNLPVRSGVSRTGSSGGSMVRASIAQAAIDNNVTIIVGAPAFLSRFDKRNSAFIFDPSGRVQRYDKTHLVPFGEFLPGIGPDLKHSLLPSGIGDFSPAIMPISKNAGSGKVPPPGSGALDCGLLICYEGAFPCLARAQAIQGARYFVNISNDAWARSPAEAEQHYALTRLRAVELSKPFVRAGNVGTSAIIDAGGKVLAFLKPYERGSIIADIVLTNSQTMTCLFGDWVGWMSFLGLPFFLTARGLLAEMEA